MGVTGGGCAGGRDGSPSVEGRIVSSAGIYAVGALPSPDQHFTASPNTPMVLPGGGCSRSGHRRPSVTSRVVSRASIYSTIGRGTTPNDHLRARPNGRVKVARCRRLSLKIKSTQKDNNCPPENRPSRQTSTSPQRANYTIQFQRKVGRVEWLKKETGKNGNHAIE